MKRRRILTNQRAQDLHKELSEARNPRLADVIERNIGIIEVLQREADAHRTRQERFADAITAFSGSTTFLCVHAIWFGAWILFNVFKIPGLSQFDPYPFGLLTMLVSLEAIFLSTIVLISQNRQALISDAQRGLDLQIDLLAEYEITRMLRLVDKIAHKLEISDEYDSEIDELCQPVAPDVVINEIRLRHERE